MMNRENLEKLEAHLLVVAEEKRKFGMKEYFRGKTYRLPDYVHEHCNTAACAAGHGATIFEPLAGEDWHDFIERIFGDLNEDEWHFIFGADWVRSDNTPQGAAARIRYLLDHGCPSWSEIYDMQFDGAPLCYGE